MSFKGNCLRRVLQAGCSSNSVKATESHGHRFNKFHMNLGQPVSPWHTLSLSPSHHVLFRLEKRQRWRKRSGGKVLSVIGNWCIIWGLMPFLSLTSAKDIHWTSSLFKPPKISRKGRCFLLRLLSDVSQNPLKPTETKCYKLRDESQERAWLVTRRHTHHSSNYNSCLISRWNNDSHT